MSGWAEMGQIQASIRKNERRNMFRRIIENFYLFEVCKESIRKLVRTVPQKRTQKVKKGENIKEWRFGDDCTRSRFDRCG